MRYIFIMLIVTSCCSIKHLGITETNSVVNKIDTLEYNGITQIISYSEVGLINKIITIPKNNKEFSDTLGYLSSLIQFNESGFFEGISVTKEIKAIPIETGGFEIQERKDYLYYDSLGKIKYAIMLSSDSILWKYRGDR